MSQLKLYLAPLQGLTEAPFRNLFARYFQGVDVYTTPFMRVEHGELRRKDIRDILPSNNTVEHLLPQFIASSADEARRLVQEIHDQGYREADINMGCAFPMLVKKGKGCGLLPHPDKVEEVLSVVDDYPDVRFSVKMRLGLDSEEESLALVDVLNSKPLSHVCIHARLGKQQYKGVPSHEAFHRVASQLKHPVVYNGDVLTVNDIHKLHEAFPYLQGVMMGRGLLAAPWLAHEYVNDMVWTDDDKMKAMRSFHHELLSHYEQKLEGGEKQLITKMKGFWEYMLPTADAKKRKMIRKAQHIAQYTQAVFNLLHV